MKHLTWFGLPHSLTAKHKTPNAVQALKRATLRNPVSTRVP